jgi:hypothetical protein
MMRYSAQRDLGPVHLQREPRREWINVAIESFMSDDEVDED